MPTSLCRPAEAPRIHRHRSAPSQPPLRIACSTDAVTMRTDADWTELPPPAFVEPEPEPDTTPPQESPRHARRSPRRLVATVAGATLVGGSVVGGVIGARVGGSSTTRTVTGPAAS